MSTLIEIATRRERQLEWYRGDARARNFFLSEANWTYDGDEHVEARDPLPVVVMGHNAGAGNGATQARLSGSEKRWRANCAKLAAGFGEGDKQGHFVLAELSPLGGSLATHELRATYGDLESVFAAGAEVNRAIIAYHRPKVIFQAGLNEHDLAIVSGLYGLRFVDTVMRPDHPTHTLLKFYVMADMTPWLAVRHFSSWGFSNRDVEAIREYAQMVVTIVAEGAH
jgi:hypothetical protein